MEARMIQSLVGEPCLAAGDVVSGEVAATMVRVGFAVPIRQETETAVLPKVKRETATRRKAK